MRCYCLAYSRLSDRQAGGRACSLLSLSLSPFIVDIVVSRLTHTHRLRIQATGCDYEYFHSDRLQRSPLSWILADSQSRLAQMADGECVRAYSWANSIPRDPSRRFHFIHGVSLFTFCVEYFQARKAYEDVVRSDESLSNGFG